MNKKKKVIRVSTIPLSLDILLKGQLSYLNEYFDIIALSSPGNHLKNVAEREKVRIEQIKMHRRISIIGDLVSLWNLFIFFRSEKPEIVHSITPKAGLLSMVAAFFAKVPIRIHTFTGLVFPSRKGLMYLLLKNMDRLTCLFATNVIPEGNGVKKDLLLHKVTRKPLSVIGNGNINGIDSSYFDPLIISEELKNKTRNELGITKSDFVYIYVGRVVKDKGINELVVVFKEILLLHPEAKLLLVGEYEQEIDPLNDLSKYEIVNNPNIIHVGFKDDIRPFLAISDVLTFPSYREGFPNVPMQAGAMGLPCIVTDINGCNEIIIDGKNGLIIPVKNSNKLKYAMLKLIDDKDLRCHLSIGARESIIMRFNQQEIWNLIKNEYFNQLMKFGKINL